MRKLPLWNEGADWADAADANTHIAMEVSTPEIRLLCFIRIGLKLYHL